MLTKTEVLRNRKILCKQRAITNTLSNLIVSIIHVHIPYHEVPHASLVRYAHRHHV